MELTTEFRFKKKKKAAWEVTHGSKNAVQKRMCLYLNSAIRNIKVYSLYVLNIYMMKHEMYN